MRAVNVRDKQVYLRFKYPSLQAPALTDKRKCLRCGQEFVVENYKVYRDEEGVENIYCPNAPECTGTVLDWADL